MKALKRICTLIDEQTKDDRYEKNLKKSFYTFYRDQNELKGGHIVVSYETGMIKTGFRPSDDANSLPYNIPGNAYMASYLELVAQHVLPQLPSSSVFSAWSKVLNQKMLNSAERIK